MIAPDRSTVDKGPPDDASADRFLAERRHEVRAHLERQYAGVFPPGQVERHIDGYVALDPARELVADLRRRAPEARTLLDVGSGYGSFVLAARESRLAAVGVEREPFETAFARARVEVAGLGEGEKVYRQADALALPFADGSFDLVTLWNVLEHAPDHDRLLTEAARVLRRGGLLFLIAPNYAAFRREAHYHLPWAPFLRGRLAAGYLRRRGRDPVFFARNVNPCTNYRTVRALKRLGLSLSDPREGKLAAPMSIASPRPLRIVAALRRLRLVAPAVRLLRLGLLNPFKSVIRVDAVK